MARLRDTTRWEGFRQDHPHIGDSNNTSAVEGFCLSDVHSARCSLLTLRQLGSCLANVQAARVLLGLCYVLSAEQLLRQHWLEIFFYCKNCVASKCHAQ